MHQVTGYRFRSTIHEGTATIVSRATREADGLRVVIKGLKRDIPVSVELARFRRECEILSRIVSEHVISYLDLAEQDDRLSLIIEDFGGESLDKLIESRPLTHYEFLEIALQVVQALDDIHSAGVVHGNVNPSNLVWHSETGQLKIIDFSIATAPWLPLPWSSDEQQLHGSLAYLSPEQIGRLNRIVDHRSDFYSLGATLYTLAVNEPPFTSSDPLETVHAHIARTPTPPHERDPSIPIAISAIIMKLLSKAPEERYQSARGIQADLRYCLNQVRAGRTSSREFIPGQHDVPEIFGISSKLYGRSAEKSIMAEALARAARGRSELVLLSGPSGVGKSALAFEFGYQPTALKARFIAGKFDQISTGAPYNAVAGAFQKFVCDLLMANQPARDQYRDRLLQSLSGNAQLIVKLVPQLEFLIGAQPPVPALPPESARNRFHLVFKQFIGAIATPEHPIVLFLDDLQWADRASLNLVGELVSDSSIRHLLIVGAYRDDEVESTNPLIQLLAKLHEGETAITELKLSGLCNEDIVDLLLDSFRSTRTAVHPLAMVVAEKTEGNPFLIHRFLTQLHEKEFFKFDRTRNSWHWDVEAIRTIGPEGNTDGLVARTLRQFAVETQGLLSRAACLGVRFELEKLQLVAGKNRTEVLRGLGPAIEAHLLSAVASTHPQSDGSGNAVTACFGFVHDQVQKAAFELVSENSRSSVHLEIGRRLLGGRNFNELGDDGFQVLEHLNRGCALIDDPEERINLSRLNFEAGLNAKAASAYVTAHEHFEMAGRLLTEDAWCEHRELTRRIYCGRAELEYLIGDAHKARELIEEALEHTENPVERADLHDLLITQHTLQGEYDEALRIGRESLAALGIDVPSRDIHQALERELDCVRDLEPREHFSEVAEECNSPNAATEASMRLLMNLLPPSDFTSADLNSWIAVKMVNMSREFGYVPESAKGFANLGNVLALRGEYERGYEFGRLALSVLNHFESMPLKPRILYTLVTYLNHWMNPLSDSRRLGDEAFKACLDVGELQYAGYVLAFHKTMNEIFITQDLDTLRGRLDEYLRFSTKTKNSLARSVVLAAYNTVANLHGNSPDLASFDSDLVTEETLIKDCESRGNYKAICLFRLLQAHALLIYCDYREAFIRIQESKECIDYVSTTMPRAILPFIEAMILSGMHDDARSLCDDGYWTRMLDHRDALQRWEALCPENFEAPSLLVQAEVARLEDRPIEAMHLYDRAAEASTSASFIPIDALANERAGRFWLSLRKPEFARNYIKKAHASFARWGAKHKADCLEEEFPEMDLTGDEAGRNANTRSNFGLPRSLDLEAVTRMSQAITSELRLERLLGKLVTTLIEAAGAQTAVLFRAEPAGLLVEAIGDVDSEPSVSLQSMPLDQAEGFSRAVVDFVARTKLEVALDNASADAQYGVDPHVRDNGVKSLLCLPIIQQQSLVGLVYLENRLATGVFTADRVGLVRVLAAEAAIAINNALLFGTVERKVEERTAELVEASRLAEKARLVAEKANRAKSDFLANMSHELRTPLNAILGYTALILDQVYGEVPERTRDVLERVDQNGRHLLGLINDVLDLSKIEAGRFTLPITEYSMKEVVEGVINAVEGLVAERNLSLKASLPPDLPVGKGNEQRISQVLLNLVGNAIKFTDTGEILVEVEVSDENFVVSVSDTGIGISKADQAKIFDEFQRGENTATREGGGTGLGLAIARRMIEMQGGHIWVESVPGKGSTFSFRLPIEVASGIEAI